MLIQYLRQQLLSLHSPRSTTVEKELIIPHVVEILSVHLQLI